MMVAAFPENGPARSGKCRDLATARGSAYVARVTPCERDLGMEREERRDDRRLGRRPERGRPLKRAPNVGDSRKCSVIGHVATRRVRPRATSANGRLPCDATDSCHDPRVTCCQKEMKGDRSNAVPVVSGRDRGGSGIAHQPRTTVTQMNRPWSARRWV